MVQRRVTLKSMKVVGIPNFWAAEGRKKSHGDGSQTECPIDGGEIVDASLIPALSGRTARGEAWGQTLKAMADTRPSAAAATRPSCLIEPQALQRHKKKKKADETSSWTCVTTIGCARSPRPAEPPEPALQRGA